MTRPTDQGMTAIEKISYYSSQEEGLNMITDHTGNTRVEQEAEGEEDCGKSLYRDFHGHEEAEQGEGLRIN